MSATTSTLARHTDARVARVIEFFEQLTPADLDRLDAYYDARACFKDPFNAVQGVPAIRKIFAHMFESLVAPRFVVRDVIAQGDQCFLTWDFLFVAARMGPGTQTIHGGSHLRFGADGRLVLHRDYWDAAEELYAKLPVVGGLVRWLRRRAGGS